MRFPFIWRKTAEDETAVWKAEATRQRKRAEKAERDLRTSEFNRRQIAALFDEQEHVTRRNAAPRQPAFDEAQARRMADRIARLCRGVANARTEAATEKRRADHLQAGLDDALGLTPRGIRDSASWQPGYVAPKPDMESTS